MPKPRRLKHNLKECSNNSNTPDLTSKVLFFFIPPEVARCVHLLGSTFCPRHSLKLANKICHFSQLLWTNLALLVEIAYSNEMFDFVKNAKKSLKSHLFTTFGQI